MKENIDLIVKETEPGSVIINVQLSGNPRELALIRRIVHASTSAISVSVSCLNDVKLAVTEACSNVIKHAFKFDTNRKFDLKFQISKKLLMVQICYEDKAFDPDNIPVPDLEKIQEGGLGVFIIRNVMDDVLYSKDSATGKVILRMVKLF